MSWTNEEITTITNDVENARSMPQQFERLLLTALCQSYHLYLRLRETVCPIIQDLGVNRMDFSTRILNECYRWIDIYYRYFENRPPSQDCGIDMASMESFLSLQVQRGLISHEDATAMFEELSTDVREMQLSPEFRDALVSSPAFQEWIGVRALQYEASLLIRLSREGALRKRHLQRSVERLEQNSGSSSVHTIEQIVNEPMPINWAMPTGINGLDAALNGGIRSGTMSMFGALSGGGKTALASQMGSEASMSDLNVLYVSTEQPRSEIVQRILSNRLDIDFSEFQRTAARDADREYNLMPSHMLAMPPVRERYSNVIQQLQMRLRVADWSSEEKTLVGGLEAEINSMPDAWRPHVIVVDWIGGALTRGVSYDKIRHVFNDAANHLARFARNNDVVVIAFAQINKSQVGPKTRRVTMAHLQESKIMADQASMFVGISGLRAEGDAEGQLASRQFFNIDKCRYAATGMVPVRPQFNHQRFVDVSGI